MKRNHKFSVLLVALPIVGFSINSGAVSYNGTATPNSTGSLETMSAPRATNSTTSTSETSVMDQSSGTAQDVEVTRTIREELSKSDKLSTSAKNVEVITLNNTVTLRGAVASQSERTQLVNVAQRAAGNRQIRNEITVDTSRR